MAGTAKGCVYRPSVTRSRNGEKSQRRTRFYWAKYRNAKGVEVRHALKLPNGDKVADKGVAKELLRTMLNRIERESVGMVDRFVESASMPMRSVLAGYVRHMRRQRKAGRRHIDQVIGCVKWFIDEGGVHRLADFDEERIDHALGMIADKGRSPRTVNVYRARLYTLAEWALKVARIIDRNPVTAIEPRDESTDTRKVRRSLSPDEAYRLLDVCDSRSLFYAVGLWAGLRVSEVRGLQWGDLVLDGNRPCLRLRAEATKSRRADELPLHPDLAEALAEVKPPFAQPADHVFKTTPILRTFKRDLERAGIPIQDERGRSVDRHALRTTFISWLGQFGVDPRAQLALARHAPQGVTLRNYQDFGVFDLWAEIRKLPGMKREHPNTAKATGTYDEGGVVPVVVPTGRRNVLKPASGCSGSENRTTDGGDEKPASHHRKAGFSVRKAIGATGFEPATSCSQSTAAGRKRTLGAERPHLFAPYPRFRYEYRWRCHGLPPALARDSTMNSTGVPLALTAVQLRNVAP